MTQTKQLSADSQPFAAPPMTEDTGEFFFELDRFLQCVNEFDLNSKSVDLSVAGAASDEFFDAETGRCGSETLRDEEVPEALLTSMLSIPSLSVNAVNQQHEPEMCDQSSHGNNNNFGVGYGYGSWQHLNLGEPMVTPSQQLQPGDSSTQLPTQSKTEKEQQVATTPETPKKKPQNQSRKRQREELEHLRASVQELHFKLETLLSCGSSDGSRSSADASEETCGSSQRKRMLTMLAQTLAWKRTASDEKRQSEQAAAENQKLRALVEGNLLVCENLRESCVRYHISSASYGRAAWKKPTAFNTESDSAIFASLYEGLDAQYQRISATWAETDFTVFSPESRQQNRLRSDSKGDFFLEHTKAHVFPFAPHAVSRTVWKLTKNGLLTPTNGELKMCRVMGNTLYATLGDTISLPNAQVSTIKVWVAMKRFIEDHQVVMSLQILVEIEHPERTVQLTASGWSVTKSVLGVDKTKPNLRGVTVAPSISQTYIRSTPGRNCAAGEDELAEGSSTARVLNQFHENMGMLDQTIENCLLDESLAGTGTEFSRDSA